MHDTTMHDIVRQLASTHTAQNSGCHLLCFFFPFYLQDGVHSPGSFVSVRFRLYALVLAGWFAV